jgi:archaemetzincin
MPVAALRTRTAILFLLPLCWLRLQAGEATPAEDAREPVKAHVYQSVLPEDERGFARLKAPKAGEWLYIYKEPAQTLAIYRAMTFVRPDAKRKNIVLQPLGPMDDEQQKTLEAMREYAEIFFQTPARVAKPMELSIPDMQLVRQVPLGNRHGTYDRQYDADKILEHLLHKNLPDDAVAYLGITLVDLWSGDLHYVFGLGSLNKRVGIYSLCRYFPEFWGREHSEDTDVMALRRACKVLNHETGHLFSLTHCIFYRCSMNGSNSLGETDDAPMEYCPVCHRKLMWNIGFDALKRYEALLAFYKKHKLDPEAEWMAKRIKDWKQVLQKEKPASPKEE